MEIPKNIDAEYAILGAALTYKQSLPGLISLKADDFSLEENKRIWNVIVKLMQDGKTPDALLVNEANNNIGIADLSQLIEKACPPGNVEHYTAILKEKERGRRLFFATRLAQAGIEDGTDYGQIETELIKAISKRTSTEETTCIEGEVSAQQMLQGEDSQPWVSFGIDALDTATGGIRPGEVCIMAARTSVGKSAAAVLATLRSAEMGWNSLYMSYEMSRRQLWYRFMAYHSRVSLRKFRDTRFDEFDTARIMAAEKDIRPALKRVRVNTDANTPGSLMSLIRMEKLQGGAEFLIIDHAGRMKADGKSRSDYERMSDVANRIKDLAINLNIPVLVLWQLNRSVEKAPDRKDKRPTLADLRDSGQAEEIADTVILLSRSNYYDKSIPIRQVTVTADVAKARDGGQLGEVQFPWLHIISKQHLVAVEDIGEEVDRFDF